MAVAYLDASAIARWVIQETGWEAFGAFLTTHGERVSSRIVTVEVGRAMARVPAADKERWARILETLILVDLDPTIASRAAALDPPSLRSLDAIHLATALEAADDLSAFVTYDKRLGDAAGQAGLAVVSPGL